MSGQVVVTGGAGFIGSHVAELLAADGDHVTIVDPSPPAQRVADRLRALGVRYHQGRVEDYHARSVAAVVHCAAPVGGLGVTQSWPVAARIVSATRAAINVAADAAAPLVNVSTSEVYGVGGAYTEATACVTPGRHSPRLGYAVGKLAAEQDAHTANLRGVVSLRPFNVVGPRQDAGKGFVLPRFVDQALAGRSLSVFGDGLQVRAFLSVYDAAAAIRRAYHALRDAPTDLGIINVGNPANRTTVLGLARLVIDAVEERTGTRVDVRMTNGNDEYDSAAYEEAEGLSKEPANIDRARDLLAWEPIVDLPSLVYDAVDAALAERRVRSAR